VLLLGACGFEVGGTIADAPRDVAVPLDMPIDVAIDAPVCTNNCGAGSCQVAIDPLTAWEVSADAGATWEAIALPHTNWPCDGCTRHYRTITCDVPTAASFRFSSDNRARMRVNGAMAFDQYWLADYCTDQPCCAKCCDTPATCMAKRSDVISLDPADLSLFTPGLNTIEWEVQDEMGGAGFYAEISLTF
jgi:hypothetical protein